VTADRALPQKARVQNSLDPERQSHIALLPLNSGAIFDFG
jgi:hypothetical protein